MIQPITPEELKISDKEFDEKVEKLIAAINSCMKEKGKGYNTYSVLIQQEYPQCVVIRVFDLFKKAGWDIWRYELEDSDGKTWAYNLRINLYDTAK